MAYWIADGIISDINAGDSECFQATYVYNAIEFRKSKMEKEEKKLDEQERYLHLGILVSLKCQNSPFLVGARYSFKHSFAPI